MGQSYRALALSQTQDEGCSREVDLECKGGTVISVKQHTRCLPSFAKCCADRRFFDCDTEKLRNFFLKVLQYHPVIWVKIVID